MLQQALKGFSYLFIVKILAKVIDIFMNISVIRNIDPKTFGLMLYFSLLENLSLFWVRACLKNSYLKRTIHRNENDEEVNEDEYNQVLLNSARNMMTFGIYLTIIWSSILYGIWTHLYGDLDPNFSKTVVLFCFGAIFESVQDAMLVKALLNFDYGLVAITEGIAISLKTIVLFSSVRFNLTSTVIAFGLSYAVFGATKMISTQILNKTNHMGKFYQVFVPVNLEETAISRNSKYIHPDMFNISIQITLVAVPKFLLQEVQRIILANFNLNQVVNGEYMFISAIGSIIPRYLFYPTEEVCYNLFAKLDQETTGSKYSKLGDYEINILQKIYKVLNLLGCLMIAFGINYTKALLDFFYGGKWNSESLVSGLEIYWFYVYLMGINGLSESFFFSTVGVEYLKKYRYFIVGNALIYIGATYLLLGYGVLGIIAADITSIIIRIGNCVYYLQRNLRGTMSVMDFMKSTLPHKKYLAIISGTFFFSYFTTNWYSSSMLRLFEGTSLGLFNLVAIYKLHKDDIAQIIEERNKSRLKVNRETYDLVSLETA